MIGNKSDLAMRREVSKEEGESLAAKHSIPYFECSAKDNLNVEDAFMEVAKSILLRDSETLITPTSVKVNVSDENSGCCK